MKSGKLFPAMSGSTLEYYENNAEAFKKRTSEADMGEFFEAFLQFLNPGDHILDAGCGPGLHAKYFIDHGYRVSGFDACDRFVQMAQMVDGFEVEQCTFQNLKHQNKFDGIWSSASLLHVSEDEFLGALKKLVDALVNNGYLFFSLKVGEGEKRIDGRFFHYFTEEKLLTYVQKISNVKIEKLWRSPARSCQLGNEDWINCILKKL